MFIYSLFLLFSAVSAVLLVDKLKSTSNIKARQEIRNGLVSIVIVNVVAIILLVT